MNIWTVYREMVRERAMAGKGAGYEGLSQQGGGGGAMQDLC